MTRFARPAVWWIAATFVASAASAQTPAVVPAPDTAALLDTPRLYFFDDGVDAEDVPWDDFDPRVHYAPVGRVHLGVQARVSALLGGRDGLGTAPMVEAALFLDVRYRPVSYWRFRVALVLSAQPAFESRGTSGNVAWSSPFGFRLRMQPLSVDLGRYVTLRLGGDIGAQWAPYSGGGGGWEFFPGFGTEIVGRLLDGRLELGLAGGGQATAIGRSDRFGDRVDLGMQGILGVLVSYLLP